MFNLTSHHMKKVNGLNSPSRGLGYVKHGYWVTVGKTKIGGPLTILFLIFALSYFLIVVFGGAYGLE
jgi:hypothetical protein